MGREPQTANNRRQGYRRGLRRDRRGRRARSGGAGLTPGLAVVLVGEDPASQVYVRSKAKQTAEAGMRSFAHQLPARPARRTCSRWSRSSTPTPRSTASWCSCRCRRRSTQKVIEAIDPAKDVDGFHPVNVGRLATGTGGLVPCTPLGCIKLLKALRARSGGLERGGGRPLQHRGQADGDAAAGRELHRHHRPFAHPRPGCRVPPRRHPRGRRRAAADDPGRLGEARRDRDRRRHQPRARPEPGRARRGSWATWISRRSAGRQAPSRPCRAASGR